MLMMMKFSKVAWVFLILVLVAGAGRVWPFGVDRQLQEDPDPADKYSSRLHDFSTQEFELTLYTQVEAFKEFILIIRSLLTSGYDRGFPSMSEHRASGIRRYGLIRIRILQGVVTLVVNTNDLYVVGFHSDNQDAQPPNACYYLRENDNRPHGFSDAAGLFEGATAVSLGYGVQYADLGDRSSVELGRESLVSAVKRLYDRKPNEMDQWKKSFLVIAQMISGCVRSDYVLNRVVQGFAADIGLYPNHMLTWVEDNWGALSEVVRESNIYGNLRSSITINEPDEQLVIYNTFQIMIHGLVTLLNKPRMPRTSFPHHHDHLLMITQQQQHHHSMAGGEEEEEEEELTTRIAGPNGTCLDVPKEEYQSGKEMAQSDPTTIA
ncbi:hypothetical protein Tsubulata_048338, partial [Turnera subulata]